MNSFRFKFLIMILLGILFNLIFWQEGLGPNLAIFVVSLVLGAYWVSPEAHRNPRVLTLMGGVVFTAAIVVISGSGTAKVGLILTAIVAIGAILYPRLRSVLTTLPLGFLQILIGVAPFFTAVFAEKSAGKEQPKRRYRVLAMSIIPLAVSLVFFLLYVNANPKLANVFGEFGIWISNLFKDFPMVRLGMILLGCVISMGALWKWGDLGGEKWEGNANDDLVRKRILRKNPIGLRKEYRTGILLLIMLNVLGAVVNVIDISWIWFNFHLEPGMSLSQLVHEGTWLLIISILLAMAVVFILFRGNLNFLSQNKRLRTLAYIWIAQNTIMVISVAIRNFHYMDFHGLAYKRIGVYFFLLLVLFGLAMVAWKITFRKSFFFVLRTNAWATWALLLILTVFNWDIVIARHNTAHAYDKEIDYEFLLSLSGKALPILCQNDHLFDDSPIDYWVRGYGFGGGERPTRRSVLNNHLIRFLAEYEAKTWLSHSLADTRAYHSIKVYLKNSSNDAK